MVGPLTQQLDIVPPTGIPPSPLTPGSTAASNHQPSATAGHGMAQAEAQASLTSLTHAEYVGEQVPSLREMDAAVVACLVEMAVAGQSDVLLKQLNHEVSRECLQESTTAL